jgi:hypothetical protein
MIFRIFTLLFLIGAGSASAAPTQSVSVSLSETPPTNSTRWRIAQGAFHIPYGQGFTGLGFGLNVMMQNSFRFESGLDSGLILWSQKGNSLTGVPLMYSVVYRLSEGFIQPFVGFSAGVIVMHANTTLFQPTRNATGEINRSALLTGTSAGSNLTFIVPVAMARLGAEVGLAKDIAFLAEAKAGVLLDLFVINPQAGFSIGL